jgi:hypothetical protein
MLRTVSAQRRPIAGLVPPLVSGFPVGELSSATVGRPRREGPPLPRMAPARCADRMQYAVSAVGANGRLGDRAVVRGLGWSARQRLDIREDHALIIVTADPQGGFQVSAQGFLLLPALVRHWCRLQAGDRVLVVADLDADRLVIHPPAALTSMIAAAHRAVWGGETR